MAPSTVASPDILDFACTDEEVFRALRKISSGAPLPQNVYGDINPYQIKHSNLGKLEDFWYYVKGNLITNTSLGHWKTKGEDREVYSNSSSTGWVTTYEFKEDTKIVWNMQKYWMSGADLCENSKRKETSSLCRIFLEYEQFQNHEKIQKDSSTISKSEAINPNHQLVVPDASKNMTNNGSTSKSEISGDDKMVEQPVAGKPLDIHSEYDPSEMDDLARGNFVELIDLDDPASPSSSSESSSCRTMSSDAMFDAMALLQDLDREMIQRDAACVRPTLPSKQKKAMNQNPSEESLVSVKSSSDPPAKANSSVPKSSPPMEGLKKPNMKQQPPSQSEKLAGRGLEGASSSTPHSKTSPAMGGKKKKKSSKFPYCFG